MKKFLNLKKVFENVGQIPVIKKFEEERALKEKCPNRYFRQFTEEMIKKRAECNKIPQGNTNTCKESNSSNIKL